MNQLWSLARILDCACLDVRTWITDLYSALVGIFMSSSQLFLLSSEAYLNAGVRLLLELYGVKVIMYVAFFTICAKLTIAITVDSLHWNFDTSVSGCGSRFRIGTKILADRRIWQKKARISGFAYPYSHRLLMKASIQREFVSRCSQIWTVASLTYKQQKRVANFLFPNMFTNMIFLTFLYFSSKQSMRFSSALNPKTEKRIK